MTRGMTREDTLNLLRPRIAEWAQALGITLSDERLNVITEACADKADSNGGIRGFKVGVRALAERMIREPPA